MSLLPSKPDTSAAEESAPRVVGVDSEDADDLLAALSSGTARRILSELHDEPVPPSKLADRVDTSLQNVQYHLENLDDAGAVEVVDTVYSEKGREMDVYAPADRPLVIYAGDEEESSSIRAALSRLLGGLGVLALGSLAVQNWVGDGVPLPVAQTGGGDGGASGGAGGDGGAAPTATEAAADTATSTPTPTPTPTATATESGDAGVMIAEETTAEAATETPAPQATAEPTETSQPAAEPTQTPTELPETTQEAADTVATEMPEATRTAVETVATGGGDFASAAGAGLPPGLLFFAGGAVVLLGSFAYWYVAR